MSRVMFDSTNVADDPYNADLIAFYIDGIYSTTASAVRNRFGSVPLVPISAIGSNAGIVGDVEPGCMSIGQAVEWVQMRRRAGVDPSLYVNEVYGWPVVRRAFHNAGVPEPHWWVADYDGIATIPAGAVAKQYANPPLTHGHFDMSIVADYWPGVDNLAGDATHSTGGFLMGLSDAQQQSLLDLVTDNHAALSRIEKTLETVKRNPDGSYSIVVDGALPNFAGWTRVTDEQLQDLKNRIETIQQAPAIGAEHTVPPGP